tara:strand:+ start:2765 stop:2998 length:234 start_codon:yes stop_codon:yes gene_type:complete
MIDAVITFLEVQVETKGQPLGQYIVLNFIDIYPNFPKVNSTVQAIKDSEGIDQVHHEWTFKKITERDDLSQFEITWH